MLRPALLVCEKCAGRFAGVNGREFGCASHKDGGDSARTNSVRVRIDGGVLREGKCCCVREDTVDGG